jgi:RNA polymerase sigma-70 factor (ECF subfamily)
MNAPEGVKDSDAASVDADEARLVDSARTDRAAFGELYDRYFDAIYHYITRRVGDAAMAEDLAAAVWERALIAIERYEVRGVPFASWLYRIAGNVVANHYRQRRLWRMVPLSPRQARSDPSDAFIESAAVRAAFRSLSAADQEVLSLHYYAELGPAEMASVLGCSLAAVHKRLGRARGRLRQQLEGDSDPA